MAKIKIEELIKEVQAKTAELLEQATKRLHSDLNNSLILSDFPEQKGRARTLFLDTFNLYIERKVNSHFLDPKQVNIEAYQTSAAALSTANRDTLEKYFSMVELDKIIDDTVISAKRMANISRGETPTQREGRA